MYSYEFRKSLERELLKLAKKDPKQLEIIKKKIDEVIENPERYKNLRYPLQHLKRVHIGHFVLSFSVDRSKKNVIFEGYEHHDDAYE